MFVSTFHFIARWPRGFFDHSTSPIALTRRHHATNAWPTGGSRTGHWGHCAPLLPETKTNRLQCGGFYMDALPPLSRLDVASGPFDHSSTPPIDLNRRHHSTDACPTGGSRAGYWGHCVPPSSRRNQDGPTSMWRFLYGCAAISRPSRGGLGAFLIIVARLLLLSIVDITQPMRAPPVGLARGIGVIAFRLLIFM